MKRLRYFIVLNFLDSDLGRRLFVPVYSFVAWLSCNLISWRFPTVKVWSRNSLLSNDIIPGVSDIDLTLYSEIVLTRDQELMLQGFHRLIRFFFPIMGEWNIYYGEDLGILKKYFNPLELSRDPNLAKIVRQDRKANKIEKLVFLLRQWQSDKHYLKDIPRLRQKKWKRISLRTEVEFEEISYTSIRNTIQALCKNSFDEIENEIAFFPHEWIGHNWDKADFKKNMMKLEKFNDFEKEIFLNQISWEVCGVLCQLPMLTRPHEMNPHFYHLSKLIEMNLPSNEADLLGRIGYLIKERYALT